MTTESQELLEVAVGIPTRDNAATIAQTIESLRAQTRRPDRLIIVDESSDDTREIIRSYADEAWVIEIIDQPQDGMGAGADQMTEANFRPPVGHDCEMHVTVTADGPDWSVHLWYRSRT